MIKQFKIDTVIYKTFTRNLEIEGIKIEVKLVTKNGIPVEISSQPEDGLRGFILDLGGLAGTAMLEVLKTYFQEFKEEL